MSGRGRSNPFSGREARPSAAQELGEGISLPGRPSAPSGTRRPPPSAHRSAKRIIDRAGFSDPAPDPCVDQVWQGSDYSHPGRTNPWASHRLHQSEVNRESGRVPAVQRLLDLRERGALRIVQHSKGSLIPRRLDYPARKASCRSRWIDRRRGWIPTRDRPRDWGGRLLLQMRQLRIGEPERGFGPEPCPRSTAFRNA
jgi:hypothetical protein